MNGENSYEYDVALSFAGQNRLYVMQVAKYLKEHNIRVFYDGFEKIEIWGKDSNVYLDNIFRFKSRYCVMFISIHYKNSRWTNHERKSALARAFEENHEYILPYRFDNTEIPGIRSTVSYLENMPSLELCKAIIQKIRNDDLDDFSFDNSNNEEKIYKNHLDQIDSTVWVNGLIQELSVNPSDPLHNLIYCIYLLKNKNLTSTILNSTVIKEIQQRLYYPLNDTIYRSTTLVILALIKHDFHESRGWVTKPSSKDYCQKLLDYKIIPDQELLNHLYFSKKFSLKLKQIQVWLK